MDRREGSGDALTRRSAPLRAEPNLCSSQAKRAAAIAGLRYPDERLLQHHAPLIELYERRLTVKQIARELDRKPDGVRASIRKLRYYGVLPTKRNRSSRIEWPIGR